MKHAPEAYFREDAASIAGALAGNRNAEQETRANLARKSIKRA
jgi:hypothetical protein